MFRSFPRRFLLYISISGATYLSVFPGDTVLHSWEVLAKILSSEETTGIVCDLGMLVAPLYSLHHTEPIQNQARRT
jgi:hypothetical protein